MKKLLYGTLAGLFLVLLLGAVVQQAAAAGRIVVVNDDWILSDTGFAAPNDPGVFATNVAAWFTGGRPGKFHAYSDHFGLTGSSLASAMTAAGHTWTTGTAGFTFNLTTLKKYDGIFLLVAPVDNNVLIDYVESGGNVYLAYCGDPSHLDEQYNSFVNHFGLGLGLINNGIARNVAIANSHPIFAGVDSLYNVNGSDILDLAPADPRQTILVSLNNHGLYAVYDGGISTAAGRIVVVNDDWILSDTGFAAPNDPGVFATNVAAWFTGGRPGKFHAYSDHFGLTGSSLASAMTAAGHTWTTGTAGFTFDLTTLKKYDGIFLLVAPVDNNVLIDYVESGGNVYLTYCGDPSHLDEQYNSFVNHFGLGLGLINNGIAGNVAIANSHPIFAGVDSLYNVNGSDILDLAPADPRQTILVSLNNHGLYAVYDGGIFTQADLAGTWYFHGLADHTASNAPWWGWGPITVDANGNIIGGTGVDSFGNTITAAGGSLSINAAGQVTGFIVDGNGITTNFPQGKLDTEKTILTTVQSISTPDSVGLDVWIKGGGTFAQADLAGTWYFQVIGDYKSANNPIWVSGTMNVDATGTVTGGACVDSEGRPDTVNGGLLTVDSTTGKVTGSLQHGTAVEDLPHGKLDADKRILTMVLSNADGRALLVALKGGGTFAQADLAGTWYYQVFWDFTSGNNPQWGSGTITFDETGTVIGGTAVNSQGQTDTLVGGALTMDSLGQVGGDVVQGNSRIENLPYGKLDASKNILTMVNSSMDLRGLFIAIKGGGTDLQATPNISTWPTASAISYGQTLASSTLSGGAASVPGSFAFTNPSTAPNVGTNPQSVTFTPTDSANYKTVMGSVNVTVNQNKATPSVTTWPTASAISYGQTLASSTLSGGAASVPGSFAFTNPATAPNVGTNPQSVTFTPTDSANYKTVAGSVNVTVNQAAASACGSANGQDFFTAPTSNLCSAGKASAVKGKGPWSWTCTGSSPGTTVKCSANLDGLCGPATQNTFLKPPHSNLCSAGKASAVTGTGPWNWTCAGSTNGVTASCSADLTSLVGSYNVTGRGSMSYTIPGRGTQRQVDTIADTLTFNSDGSVSSTAWNGIWTQTGSRYTVDVRQSLIDYVEQTLSDSGIDATCNITNYTSIGTMSAAGIKLTVKVTGTIIVTYPQSLSVSFSETDTLSGSKSTTTVQHLFEGEAIPQGFAASSLKRAVSDIVQAIKINR